MGDVAESLVSTVIPKYHYETDIMSLEWWQKSVIYHIYLPSFSDGNNDGIGDFKGLVSELNYFEDLNVKTLLISPFYPSPMKDNGYDVTSYTDIDPIYGTMNDFCHFMNKVKERDLNVVIDLVANHTSDQHPWFQKSIRREHPYTDFYIWADKKPESTDEKKLPPNNWLSVFGGSAWTWNEHRKQFYFHQFLPEQPDLNFRNPLVREEIKNVMRFWMDKGVDGFRIDAASHLFEDERLLDEPLHKTSKAKENEYQYLDHIYTKGQIENFDILKEFRAVLDEYEEKTGKSKLMITEVTEDIEDVMNYYGGVGDKLADFPFNFQLYKVKANSTGNDLFEKIVTWLRNMPKGKYPNWVLSSHDDPRIITRVGKRLASSLLIVIMLLPGIPICYYGDELGMENASIEIEDIKDSFALRTSPNDYGKFVAIGGFAQWFFPFSVLKKGNKFVSNSRDPMRTPMQWNGNKNAGFSECEKTWLPVHKNFKTVNVEAEKEDTGSYLSLFKAAVKFRAEPSVLVGLLEFPLVNENVFSFLRYLEGTKCYLLVLNMSSKSLCINLSNTSHFLPTHGFLELSNCHILESKGEDFHEENLKKYQCKCVEKDLSATNFPSASLETKLKMPLNCIHLHSKEAIVLSFIGGQKL